MVLAEGRMHTSERCQVHGRRRSNRPTGRRQIVVQIRQIRADRRADRRADPQMPSTSFVQIRQAGARAGAQQLGHGAPLGAEAQLAELLGQQRRVQATPRRRPLQAPTAARRAVRQPRRRQAGRQADAGPQPGGSPRTAPCPPSVSARTPGLSPPAAARSASGRTARRRGSAQRS
ncbi:unnamed protein product [Prorocentrum cordatum]|uniref:Uncharacterized protein n=2 Tax=Prorocentrum cordatum TaxID=2364126 RepID=A0ABN9SME0_9DINO|nr:unnamed protein product [Polarella glacialis]